jgi:hypothetical protein
MAPLGGNVKTLNVLCLCVALLICSSCTNIKSKKVTEENKEKVLSEISTSTELTNEEKQLLLGYFMRQNMATIFQGGKPGLPSGKTLGEMIQDQKKWVAQEKEEEERQKHLAAEIAGKQAEMRNIIGVALYSFARRRNSLIDYVEAGYAYENRSTRDVRAFDGWIVYNDVLGNKLEEVRLKVLKPIKAGQKASVTDDLPFMAYGGLRDKVLDDVRIEWRPKKILFADGSSVEVGSQD